MSSLYDRISNPVNINTIDEILNRYCSNTNFYNALVGQTCDKDKVTGKFNTYYNDQLLVFLFNKWKNSIIGFCKNINQIKPEYRDLFLTVGRFIYDKNPTTSGQVLSIINYYDENNSKLSDAMEKLKWNSVGEYSSWDHIDSSAVLYGRHSRDIIEHRLYLNCDSTYTHQIAYELVKRCHERHQRYYFKFDEFGNRDDTLVIYCSSDSINTFVDILNEIKRDLQLDDKLHTPPLLTGKIDGWIGYGSEPDDVNGKRYSFNTKREEHLSKCIREETAAWIGRNKEHSFNINGKKMSYRDYVVEKLIISKKNSLTKYTKDDDKFYSLHRFHKTVLDDSRFKDYLRTILKNNFDYIIRSLYSNDKDFKLEFKVEQGTYSISKYDLEGLLKDQIKFIMKVSSKYRYDLLGRIRNTASNFDIDPSNYAFDISKKGALENAEEKNQRDIRKKI